MKKQFIGKGSSVYAEIDGKDVKAIVLCRECKGHFTIKTVPFTNSEGHFYVHGLQIGGFPINSLHK